MKSRHSPRIYAPRMRDIETIDGDLRLLLAIRQVVREEEVRTLEPDRLSPRLNS